MNYNVKYLLSGIFIIVFIGFLVWMRYFNQRKEEEHSDMSFEARLDSEVKALYKQLGLGEASLFLSVSLPTSLVQLGDFTTNS